MESMDKNAVEEIKGYFKEIIEIGIPGVSITGPNDNVLIMEDWNSFIDVGSILRSKGLVVKSPGGYGYSHPKSRQLVHYLVWTAGSLCSIVVKRRLFFLGLPDSMANEFSLVTKDQEIDSK